MKAEGPVVTSPHRSPQLNFSGQTTKSPLHLTQPTGSDLPSRRAPPQPPILSPIQPTSAPNVPAGFTPIPAPHHFVPPIPPSPLYLPGQFQGQLPGQLHGLHPASHSNSQDTQRHLAQAPPSGGFSAAQQLQMPPFGMSSYPYLGPFSIQGLPSMPMPLGFPMGSPALASPWTQAMVDTMKSRTSDANPGPSPHTLAVQSIDELAPKTPHAVPSLSPSAWPLVPPSWLPQSLPKLAPLGGHPGVPASGPLVTSEPSKEAYPPSTSSAGTSSASTTVDPSGPDNASKSSASRAPSDALSPKSKPRSALNLALSSSPVTIPSDPSGNTIFGTIPPSAHVAQSPWSLILAHQHLIQLQAMSSQPGSQQEVPGSPINSSSSSYYAYPHQQYFPSSEGGQGIWSPNGFLPSPPNHSAPNSASVEPKVTSPAPQAGPGVKLLPKANTTENIVLDAAPKTILRRGRKASVRVVGKSEISKSENSLKKGHASANQQHDPHEDSMDDSEDSLEYSEDEGKKTRGRKKKMRIIRVSKERLRRKPRKDRYWLDQQANLVVDLEKHGFSAILGDSGSFSCSLCGKDFETKLLCVRHAVEHLDYKPFKCAACLMEFTRCDTLQRHLKGRCLGSAQPVRGEEGHEKPRDTKFIPPVVQPSH